MADEKHVVNELKKETASDQSSKSLGTPTKETLDSSRKNTKQMSEKPLKKQLPKENTTSPQESKQKSTKVKKSDNPDVKLMTPNQDSAIETSGKNSKEDEQVSQPLQERSNEEHTITKKIINGKCVDNKIEASEIDGMDSSLKYDTFICYAKKNRDIAAELKMFLETQYELKVCIDFENFVPGITVATNICNSINSSRSTVFLLSSEFCKKLWAPWELSRAVYDFNKSRKCGQNKKIIPILLEQCELPDELEIYTEMDINMFASREQCWQKLAVALSSSCDGTNETGNNVDNIVESSDQDVEDHEDEQGSQENCNANGEDDSFEKTTDCCHGHPENETISAGSDDPSENIIKEAGGKVDYDEKSCNVQEQGDTNNQQGPSKGIGEIDSGDDTSVQGTNLNADDDAHCDEAAPNNVDDAAAIGMNSVKATSLIENESSAFSSVDDGKSEMRSEDSNNIASL